MRKRIVFVDNMEALAGDENAVQGYVQEWGDDLVNDFLQAPGQRGYVGLKVSRKTSTTVTVAAGRYYDGSGRQFGRDDALDIDITQYLPAVGGRILAVVCYGEEVDANKVYRNFVDPATEEAVPRQVNLEQQRALRLTIVAGAEAGTPVNPAISATYLGVAYVRLTVAGIASQSAITQITSTEIRSLDDGLARIGSLEDWRKLLTSSVSSLRSDLADLSNAIKGLANTRAITTIAKEVARIREEIGLPDDFSSSHADNYMSPSESMGMVMNPNWRAKIEEGIRFADANVSEQPIALLSAIDAAVQVSPGGLMLPRYTEGISLSIGNVAAERDSELPMAQYQTTTISGDVLTLSRLRQRYGEEFVVSTGSRYWQTGEYDPVNGVFAREGEIWEVADTKSASLKHQYKRTTRFFEDRWADAYWAYGATEKSVTGKVLVQTRLASATCWVTRYDLRFTQVAPSGDVTLLVVPVEDGKPDLTQILAHATVAAGDLVENDWTPFRLEPFVMVRGYRYALVVVTAGNHWVQISTNNDYTQGTLFTLVDGDFPIAMADKDMCFQEWRAHFASTKTVVDLQPWSLDGGITGVDVMAPSWSGPPVAQMSWEIRVNNKWYPLAEVVGTTPFVGLPALVQARLVLTHTQDIAPGVRLGTSRVRLTRPHTDGRAFSVRWTMPSAFTSVSMTVLLSSFDEAYHSFTPRIGYGHDGDIAEADTLSFRLRKDGVVVVTALFSVPAGTSTYSWDFQYSTSNPLKPFVIEETTDALL